MSREDWVEVVSLTVLAVAVLFFCWVFGRLLLTHHDPDVPTHGAPWEIHVDV